MKIAYVYDAVYPYQIGGVEKRIFELGKRLASKGHDIHIFGLRTWDGDSSFSRDGIRYRGVGYTRSLYREGRRSVGEAVYFGFEVLGPLLHERFDVIDCQNFPYFSCFSSYMASKLKKSRLVITWHEVWGDYWYEYLGGYGFFGKLIEKMAAILSTHLVAVSAPTKDRLQRLAGPIPIRVIGNGIDLWNIDAVQPSDQVSDIFFSGRLVREKKADVLVKAIAVIRKQIPDIRVVIAGDGPERDRLHELVHHCDVEGNIQFIGFVQDSDRLLSRMKSSKVFASPSVREGFGIAAIEAMACGLPVVTSNAPENAVKDFINERTGIVSAISPEAFAEAILECLGRSGSMREDCKTAAGMYDWDSIVREIEHYYEGIVNHSS